VERGVSHLPVTLLFIYELFREKCANKTERLLFFQLKNILVIPPISSLDTVRNCPDDLDDLQCLENCPSFHFSKEISLDIKLRADFTTAQIL
jgi:hypothetical protein